MIRLQNVSYAYTTGDKQKIQALIDINLEIQDGEFIAIIGPNGAGKTTLVKMLNGLLVPDTGDVLVGNLNTNITGSLIMIRSKVGLVFANPDNQIIASTVEEDVAFGLENLGMEPYEMKIMVKEMLKMLGISDLAKHSPHNLSAGQKRKVTLAGLLVMEPDYLVLDDPGLFLDLESRNEILEIIKNLHKQGIGIIYISQLTEDIVHADRTIVLYQGRVVMDGSSRAVISRVYELVKYHINIPPITQIAYDMRRRGITMPEELPVNVEEMMKHIWL